MKSCRRSTTPLACGSRGAQKCQPTRKLPAEAGELRRSGGRRRRAARTGDPRPASAAAPRATTDSAGSRTAAPASAWRRPARRRRRASSPGTRRRPTPARVWPCPTGTSALRLPEVELADLARPIDRPLIGPRRRKQRPHLAQIVIDDRLAALEPERRDQLPHPLPRHLRILLEQPMDLVLERIQLRPRRRAPIPRRRRRPQRRPDRVAAQPGPPRQLLDRDAADEVLATQLGPLLHADQPLPPLARPQTEPGSPSPRTPPPRARRGSIFDRRRGVSFHPAPTRDCCDCLDAAAPRRLPRYMPLLPLVIRSGSETRTLQGSHHRCARDR